MSLAATEEALCTALYAAWTGGTIIWPNQEPASGAHPREGTASWAAFHILHDGSDQHSLGESGNRTFTRTGRAVLQIFVPTGQRGLEESTALATVAINVFEGKSLAGIRLYRVGLQTVGLDGSWFQVNVKADFEFDEVK
jgi:hypothetical protein